MADALYDWAREAMDAGDLPRATVLFHASAHERPHFKTYELLGECYVRQGELTNAMLYLAAAAGLGQRQSRSRYLLAQALEARGDVVHAIAKLDEALEAQRPRTIGQSPPPNNRMKPTCGQAPE